MVEAAENRAAEVLAEHWAGHRVARVSPRDLSLPGWRFVSGHPELGRCVTGGEVVPEGEIDGALTLLPAVTADQLPWIVAEDRSYAAAEMHAFLFAWLSALPCPVLSRPSVGSLCGVAWPRERWLAFAAAHDVPIGVATVGSAPAAPYTLDGASNADLRITVIGDEVIGTPHGDGADYARRLASAAGADALVVEFSYEDDNVVFRSAYPFPDVCDSEVAAAVLRRLTGDR